MEYYYFLSVPCLVFISIGLYLFFHKGIQTSHFSGLALREDKTTLSTEILIIGQYKTIGEGFFVGKKITVCAALYFRDKQLYEGFKRLPEGARVVVIENSEDPEDAERDISEAVRKGQRDEAFTNPGRLRMVEFYDEKQTIVLEGDVVFTREGEMTFGMPLKPILERYKLRIGGIDIAPSYVRHQIYWSKVVVLLTFITIAVAFLSLLFALHNGV